MSKRGMAVLGLAIGLAVGMCGAAAEPGHARDRIALGPNASLGGARPFPDDNPWNLDISRMPVDPEGEKYIASIGADAALHPDFGRAYAGKTWGLPYRVVSGDQPRVPIRFSNAEESDHGYYPLPPDAPVEESGDRHLIVIDRDHWMLYELFGARQEGGVWRAACGAVFDLKSNALRPAGWTSADAAGLPIFPGLVRYDEVMEQKEIRHALRFTAPQTRRAYVYPARHFASRSTESNLPPMGLRVRLRASYDIGDFPPAAQVILKALKTYGMILADNGGSWFLTGSPHPDWPDAEINALKRIRGSDFEVVYVGNLVTR